MQSYATPRHLEKLDRGVVATYTAGKALVNWRIFGDDPANIEFNVYAKINGGTAVKQNGTPISGVSNYLVSGVSTSNTNVYFIKPVINGTEGEASKSFTLKGSNPYISVPLNVPAGGTTPDNRTYTYEANDCSVGDLDGDGNYEIIVKWNPSLSSDNTPSGPTGNTYFDAYTLEGERLWRIDLGNNIRSGPHYTQFMVYDLDGDGKAEVACKTAPGTKDATGNYISTGPAASADHGIDYRTEGGMILSGPEYLTIFNGLTGKEMITTYYIPRRHPDTENPTSSQLNNIWGDGYGNRVDRFLACIAYLDGVRPSLVMCRGYYTRTVIAAFDFRGGELSERWVFDTMDEGNEAFAGQGNHNLSVADVDGDGKDEIIYGSMSVDDNGTGLYSTGLGHGDAMHVSDLNPEREGMEIFVCHEDGGNGVSFRDVATGQILWQHKSPGSDIGRGVAFDIDPNYPGAECWASNGAGIYACQTGQVITSTYPITPGGGQNYNMAAWWDGDLLRELVDKTVINKWNWNTKGTDRLLTTYQYGVSSNNWTKSNPCLIADILGDWREEIIHRTSDSKALYIFCTTNTTTHGLYTLMHDPQYRLSIAWQNVGYNQPAHTSFFLGANMATPPTPDAVYIDASDPYPSDNTIPVIEDFGNQNISVDENCLATLPDFSKIINVIDDNYISFNSFQSPVAGTPFTVDDSLEVSIYVNDGNGNNSNTLTFTAYAIDATPPVITKGFGDHTIRADANCKKAIPDYTNYVTFEDYCSDQVTVSMTPAAGTILSGDGDSVVVTLTFNDNKGNISDSTFTVTLNADGCYPAAVNETEDGSDIIVYPNPLKDKLFIKASVLSDIDYIEIKSLDGKLIKKYTNLNTSSIDVSQLQTGVYIVSITTSKQILTEKVVKY